MNNRKDLLEGTIELPKQILEIVGAEQEVAKEMFQAVWYNYLKNKKSTNSTYWYDKFEDKNVFNQYVMHLSKSGWITSTVLPKRHWAELSFNEAKLSKYVTATEVEELRYDNKLSKYLLTERTCKRELGLTKTPKGIKSVGIKRKGFSKSAKALFKLDVEMLMKYEDAIVLNVTKGIKKMDLDIDIAEYSNVAKGVIDTYICKDKEYCMNGSISDSRGRNIFKGLSKIFNPVGFKDARALLVIEPKSLGITGMSAVEEFVAELLSIKCDTKEERRTAGRQAIVDKTLHTLDLSTVEGREDLHENIWLERIYANVEVYDGSNWIVPIELDFTASILAIEGTLLGDYKYMDLTNIVGDVLKDAWTIEGVSRKQVKACMTPILYGSSETIRNLWSHRDIKFTEKQVQIMSSELTEGRFKLANMFKNYIIKNVQVDSSMTVTVWNDTFEIKPNRYRNVGEFVQKYNIYDTSEARVITIRHTHTKRVPDLEQFKLYFPTLLVHGVDSQISDEIAEALGWCIDIHDAWIVHPADANKVRVKTVEQLNKLHSNRDIVLGDFFRSTGVSNKHEWAEIRRETEARKDISITANVLK